MQTLKNYAKEFVNDESGMELLQLVAGIIVTVLIMVPVFNLGKSIYNYVVKAQNQADSEFSNSFNMMGNGNVGP